MHEIDTAHFTRFNGFYNRPDAGDLIYALYEGKCQATDRKIDRCSAHIGHIIPQASSALFENLYPGLDVHNAVNLHLISAEINTRNSDFVIRSPAAIHHVISYTARRVHYRLPKLLAATTKKEGNDCKVPRKEDPVAADIRCCKVPRNPRKEGPERIRCKVPLKKGALAILDISRRYLERARNVGCKIDRTDERWLLSVSQYVADFDIDHDTALTQYPHYCEWERERSDWTNPASKGGYTASKHAYRLHLSGCCDLSSGARHFKLSGCCDLSSEPRHVIANFPIFKAYGPAGEMIGLWGPLARRGEYADDWLLKLIPAAKPPPKPVEVNI